MCWVRDGAVRVGWCRWVRRVRGVGREAVVEGCDSCDGLGFGGEVVDCGESAGRGLQGVAPGTAVDVAGEMLARKVGRDVWGDIGREVLGGWEC